jgi:hypothetical protein
LRAPLHEIERSTMDAREIVIVSGLPRSGTSMMMKMLEAGGLAILTDNVRSADEDNPKGYYEFEPVKQIEHDKSWLPTARGKVVKMISALLRHLPLEYRYRVIFMRREMAEVLASQRQMLMRRGEVAKEDDERMAALFERHLAEVEAWLGQQTNVRVLFVSYNNILVDPRGQIRAVNEFLGGGLDADAMAAVVDRALHRQRRGANAS